MIRALRSEGRHWFWQWGRLSDGSLHHTAAAL